MGKREDFLQRKLGLIIENTESVRKVNLQIILMKFLLYNLRVLRIKTLNRNRMPLISAQKPQEIKDFKRTCIKKLDVGKKKKKKKKKKKGGGKKKKKKKKKKK